MNKNKIICGDALLELKKLESESVDSCITSPPYFGLRDYGVSGQIGLEETPEEYVSKMVLVFREVKRVLKDEGVMFLNLGDSYNGSGKGRNGDGTPGKTESLNKNNRGSMNGIIKPFHRPSKTGNFGGTIHRTSQNALRASENVSFGNLKQKDLVGIPWRVAFALQADGWYLRQDIIWAKPNPMPESVTDRCTKSHEYIFLLSKSPKYYFDNEAIREPNVNPARTNYTPGARTNGENKDRNDNDWADREKKKLRPHGIVRNRALAYNSKENAMRGMPEATTANEYELPYPSNGRNKRSVWTVSTMPYAEAHFATFPENLVSPMIKAGCPKGGLILDPFFGAGTTGVVAKKLQRNYIGIDISKDYCEIARKRLQVINPMF